MFKLRNIVVAGIAATSLFAQSANAVAISAPEEAHKAPVYTITRTLAPGTDKINESIRVSKFLLDHVMYSKASVCLRINGREIVTSDAILAQTLFNEHANEVLTCIDNYVDYTVTVEDTLLQMRN